MHFWKIIRNLLDEVPPDWQDNFISYKDLKKQLKLIYPIARLSQNLGKDDDLEERPHPQPRLRRENDEMKEFLKLVLMEIRKINWFFEYKEDQFVIKLQLLKAEISEAKDSKEELTKLRKKMVDFHGEMVLMKSYSALNYIGMLKILKKYDKRSGNLVRMSFIEKVVQEPFIATDVINNLVAECEMLICHMFSLYKQSGSPKNSINHPASKEQTESRLIEVPKELAEFANTDNKFVKLSRSALRTMNQIRSGSKTVDVFSLPPMEFSQYGDLDESLK